MHLSRVACFWTWICFVNKGLMERGPYGHCASNSKTTVMGNLSQTWSAEWSTWCLCWLLFLSTAPSSTPGKLQSGIKKIIALWGTAGSAGFLSLYIFPCSDSVLACFPLLFEIIFLLHKIVAFFLGLLSFKFFSLFNILPLFSDVFLNYKAEHLDTVLESVQPG